MRSLSYGRGRITNVSLSFAVIINIIINAYWTDKSAEQLHRYGPATDVSMEA